MNFSPELLIYSKAEVGPVKKKEAFRYAGVKEAVTELESLLDECIKEADRVIEYKIVCREYDDRIVFAATVGMGMDRLISRYGKVQPSKALIMSGLGSERVESLCDCFCEAMKEKHPDRKLKTRVSPGYGQWPLSMQTEIFRELNVTSLAGIYLNDKLFMTPEKSVTAIIYFEQ